uniref:Reverse transcriptase domain-containing protein n=1 Tax=Fagus sylvatica TaxID=28930 RepID=A0A2N9IE82_FAGSY
MDLASTTQLSKYVPWCCMGDFNELVRIEEKQGRHTRSERQMQLFRDVLDDCGFVDLGFNGPKFTWTNNRIGDMTWERLDRAVATPEWLLRFPLARVHHLDVRWSDHKPLWVSTNPMIRSTRKPFRFEEVWTSDQGCEEVVAKAWKKSVNGVPMFSVWEKIHTCRRELRSWSKHNFGNIKNKIKEIENQLQQAEEASMQGRDHHQVWLETETPVIFTTVQHRGSAATMYISSKTQWGSGLHIMPRVFTPDEVAVALKQMSPLKAPGPDGLPPLFYHKYWHLIGEEVTKAVLTCLNTGKILRAINHTYITLIPKVQNPEVVMDFRPISLCNVIYKIISKVLANRLKTLLPRIVSESQSAFVPGRLITDNILVAFETLHHMQHQTKGNVGSMALKLDMSKAYDRVEWKYLQRVMERMGFHSKWVTIMMECISTVSYSILVNGEPHGFIKPSRGLCQGDLLSPYLFLLCVEGREVLIKSVAQAIPAYAMSCFRLPTRLIKEIEVLIRRFWWGQSGEKAKMHWLSWNTLCKSKANGGIGFRELGSFNEALLAKQVWRLLHNPSSLFYKVFKSKYFPRCSILEAQLVSTSSYAWKSIMSARDVIKKGAIWRVGTGSNIQIWGDRWLPTPHHHLITSPRLPNSDLSQVAHLIDHQTRLWKRDLITANFLPHDAITIMGIPLSSHHLNDSLIWGGTKDGRYAVRSGYHLLMNERAQAAPGPSDNTVLTQLWHTIWWLQVETVLHALWHCKTIHLVWQALPWGRKLAETSYLDFMDLVLRGIHLLSVSEMQLFTMVSWLIWFHRNRMRMNQPTDQISRIVPRAQELITEFITRQEHHPVTSMQPRVPDMIKWTPPAEGRYKVNYDGAIFRATNEAGLGVIIRNARGEVMGSLSQRVPFPHSVEAVEASAAKCAIQFAKDLGIMEIDLEGDSKSVVDALLLHGPCTTIYGHLIEDIKWIARGLCSVHFKHVKWDGNILAHLLAKRAHLNESLEVWLESVPPELVSKLVLDSSFQ